MKTFLITFKDGTFFEVKTTTTTEAIHIVHMIHANLEINTVEIEQ